MTNFDCDKVIILYYAIGAGGRFIANNLSLSSDCVMMHSKLAMMQLEGKLDSKQKLLILLNRLNSENKDLIWNDLGFSLDHWIGREPSFIESVSNYRELSDHEYRTKIYVDKGFQHITENNSKYLFLITHCPEELDKQLSVWKNARVISFKNDNLFRHMRRLNNAQPHLKTIWSLIPEEEKVGWVAAPLSKKRFENLPENIKRTVWKYLNDPEFISKVAESENLKYSVQVPRLFSQYKKLNQEQRMILESENTTEEYVYPDSVFVWDCNWYLNEESTLHNIKNLYDVLELDDYNDSYSRCFYKLWIKKLEEVS